MKKSRLLASLLALSVAFTLTLGISAFAAEDTENLDDTAVIAATAEAPTVSADDSMSETAVPVTFAEIGNKKSSYSTSNPSVKFKLPSDFECVTLESSSGDISHFQVSKADFISYGYVAYGISEKSSSYFYFSRTQDEYSKLIGNYNSLSKKELDEIVSEMSQTVDQSTGSSAYESTEKVKINGQTYVKTSSTNATTSAEVNVVEYNTVHDGYNYTISYIYPVTLSEESVENFVGSVNSIKFSFSFDLENIIPYVAFFIGILSLAIGIILYVKYSEMKQLLKNAEAADAEDGQSDGEENYYGFTEESGEDNSEAPSETEINEAAEEITEEVTEEVTESEE